MAARVDALLARLAARGRAPALVDSRREYHFADLCAAIDARGADCATLGIGTGDVVALRAEHSFGATAWLLALLRRRAIVALLPRHGDERSLATTSQARHVLDVDDRDWSHRAAVPPAQPHALLERLRAEGDAGLVLFTSGATGRPKAALQCADRFLRKFDRPGKPMRTLAFLLFDHVAGLDTLCYTLAAGGTLVCPPRRDPDSVLAAIARHRVEVLAVSPSFLRLLCATDALDRHDASSLRIVTYGSEPMDAPTLARVHARLPGVRIVQKYGTTETGSPRTVSRGDDSLWVRFAPDPEVETRVIDGVLWIRSPRTILGYLDAPSPLAADGWYCTGDLVDVDREWLRFRGRRSEAISVGGEKVAPTEVERAILEVDGVTDVTVGGAPHALLGQIVTARVVLPPELPAGEWLRRIRRHCVARLPRHAVPVQIEVVHGPLAGARHKKVRR